MMTLTYLVAALSIRPQFSIAFSSPSSVSIVPKLVTRSFSIPTTSFSKHSPKQQWNHYHQHPQSRNQKLAFSHLLISSSSSSSLADSSSSSEIYIQNGVSRLETLQQLLSIWGAPGSSGCNQPNGDLTPIPTIPFAQLVGENKDFLDLHPHLYPLAKSQSTGRYICALRRPHDNDDDPNSSNKNDVDPIMPNNPLPIVEGGIGLPGMKLLSLNSELLMRRIAAEADFLGGERANEIMEIYNNGLGEGKIKDSALDTVYESGSVAKLGYGSVKYTLLRIGPFPDLYESMSNEHLSRNDEPSSLIAAESANSKFTNFGSTFAFYSQLLSTLPNREAESRDAARVCLRLPLSSVALTNEDLAMVGTFACLATKEDGMKECFSKMKDMYEKMREQEGQEKGDNSGKTIEQLKLDEANYLLDTAILTGRSWSDIRDELGNIYVEAGQPNIANFVNPDLS